MIGVGRLATGGAAAGGELFRPPVDEDLESSLSESGSLESPDELLEDDEDDNLLTGDAFEGTFLTSDLGAREGESDSGRDDAEIEAGEGREDGVGWWTPLDAGFEGCFNDGDLAKTSSSF